MKNYKNVVYIFTILIIFVATQVSTGNSMNIFKNDFEQRWKELFKDVGKLNEYTAIQPITFRNAKVEGYNIDGAIFTGSKFNSISWTEMSAAKSKFTKVIFKDCTFLGVNFEDSILTDVVFDNCKIGYSNFSGCTMVKTVFMNCEIIETALDGTDGDVLKFNNCTIGTRSAFSGSKISFDFKNTILSGVNMMGLNGGLPLLIEGGLLSEVDFSKSHFSTVTLRRVRQGEGGVYFNGVTAESINFEDVDMLEGTGIGDATVGMVRIVGGQMYGPTFKKANIDKTYIRNAYVTRFALGNMGQVHVDNSTMHRSGFFQGGIDEFSITNSTLDEIVGENFKANIVLWDNVTLDGKIDLTNAQVKDFRPTRLKRGPRLNLITTGSNMRF